MNTIAEHSELPPEMLLHCGAERVGRTSLKSVPTPEPTESWFPLPHDDLIGEVEDQLSSSGFEIERHAHALSHSGARYFGILQLRYPGTETRDYSWIVGLRNSHDKSYPAGLVAGTRVFVCDNLAFIGEVQISRKHTRHATRDLKHLTARAIGQLGDRFHELDRRVITYKGTELCDRTAHDLVVRAVDCRAITPRQLPSVLQQWRKPAHRDFEPRNAWSLFNAFTEVLKTVNPHTATNRGQALHGLFDSACGVN